MPSRLLLGKTLHRGDHSSVTLQHLAGKIHISQRGAIAPLDALRVVRSDCGVQLADPVTGVAVDLAEHLLAAVAGLGIRSGLRIDLDGEELPLLDGGSRAWCEALLELPLRSEQPRLQIVRDATLTWGASVYRFSPAAGIDLQVRTQFDHPCAGDQSIRWLGDPDEFRRKIAPCRTFGFLRDLEPLLAANRARGIEDMPVIVLTDTGTYPGYPEPRPGELCGHKLLDLIGDLALYGGPPCGTLIAERPGHTATHQLLPLALRHGIVAAR